MRSLLYAPTLFSVYTMVYAQQDPDDPGNQDSVIIETVTINEAMRSVLVISIL